MTVGKSFTITQLVEENMLACNVGSGAVKVFATPMMIALIEKCAAACIQDELSEGEASVGTMVNVSHCAATPLGMKVTATAVVTAVDGRKVSFNVKAEDECGLIGEGTHERFVINVDKFNSKTAAKSAL